MLFLLSHITNFRYNSILLIGFWFNLHIGALAPHRLQCYSKFNFICETKSVSKQDALILINAKITLCNEPKSRFLSWLLFPTNIHWVEEAQANNIRVAESRQLDIIIFGTTIDVSKLFWLIAKIRNFGVMLCYVTIKKKRF